MHTFGHPCRIDRIKDICDNFHISLIEDAAESMGSFYKDKHTGTFGRIGQISFNGNKIITGGGGGCIITDDELLAKKAKHLTTTAKVSHKWEYTHNMIGYNYRMPNLNAALLLAQLENLEVFQRARAGMFLSFQYPAAIPGVQVGTFLKKSVASVRDDPPKGRAFRKELTAAMEKLSMDKSFLSRYVNDGFSGGEKKRLEILQMLLLQPHLALLDETDSGLDIDALRIVANGVNKLKSKDNAVVIIDKEKTGDFEMPNIRSSHDMALWLLIMKRGFSAYGLDENLIAKVASTEERFYVFKEALKKNGHKLNKALLGKKLSGQTQIAKAEPSQTQKVATVDLIFCAGYPELANSYSNIPDDDRCVIAEWKKERILTTKGLCLKSNFN